MAYGPYLDLIHTVYTQVSDCVYDAVLSMDSSIEVTNQTSITICFYWLFQRWSNFDQFGAALMLTLASRFSSQGYPQLLWISFQATLSANWRSFCGLDFRPFRLLTVRRNPFLAPGDTNSTCVPSENCNIQISHMPPLESGVATTPLIVFTDQVSLYIHLQAPFHSHGSIRRQRFLKT